MKVKGIKEHVCSRKKSVFTSLYLNFVSELVFCRDNIIDVLLGKVLTASNTIGANEWQNSCGDKGVAKTHVSGNLNARPVWYVLKLWKMPNLHRQHGQRCCAALFSDMEQRH